MARPVPSSAEQLLETIETKLGTFHGSLFTALHGSEPDAEELDLPSLEIWGRLVAQVHTASQGFETAGRKSWKEELERVRQVAPESHEIVHREIAAVERILSSFDRNDTA